MTHLAITVSAEVVVHVETLRSKVTRVPTPIAPLIHPCILYLRCAPGANLTITFPMLRYYPKVSAECSLCHLDDRPTAGISPDAPLDQSATRRSQKKAQTP